MHEPTIRLIPTAARVTPEQPLPVAVAVENPTNERLHGASAELTLEVEKGVLLSWELILAEVPAGGHLDHAVLDSRPPYRLPLGTVGGDGIFRARLYSSAGAQLAETELKLPVMGSVNPS